MNKRLFLTISLFFLIAALTGQPGSGKTVLNYPEDVASLAAGKNELTIYVIPPKVRYDWTSPRTLYKSYYKNSLRCFFKKDSYTIGHAFVKLQTGETGEEIFAGMRIASKKEHKELVFRQHYGLAILGADTKGKLESAKELERTVSRFSRKGDLAFMTFFINDEAADRMISFFDAYRTEAENGDHNGLRYGGAFYPRYKGEGSGCTAFVVSFLDLAGILKDEYDKWLVRFDIPMSLIGGPYNNNKEVRLRDIKRTDNWIGDADNVTDSHEHLEIYDPALMFDWILEKWREQEDLEDMTLIPLQLQQARGIMIDAVTIPVPPGENIFIERENPSIFIDYYNRQLMSGY